MSKKKLTYDDFKQYFGNNMSEKDKHAFEKKMMQDAFEEEAFDGLSELSKEELGNDVAELKAAINKRTKQTRKIVPVWFKYAASVLLLVGIGLTFYLLNSKSWQDMMLKNQVAKEMEIADSLVRTNEKSKAKPKPDYKLKEELNTETSQELMAEKDVAIMEESSKKISQNELVLEDNLKISEPEDEIYAQGAEDVVFDEEFVDEEISPLAEKKVTAMKNREGEEEITSIPVNKEKSAASVSLMVPESEMNRLTSKLKKETTPEKYETRDELVIRGKIVSADHDLSLPGVSVVIKDYPGIGTTTDIEGEFELKIPDDEDLKTLIASFVGMQSREITIENDSNILVYMEPDVLEMDEVVVTGYAVDSDKDGEVLNTSAQPPGNLSLRKYKEQILEKLDYQKLSDFPGEHRVKVSFTVLSDGSLSSFNCRNVPDIVFCSEIRRIIKKLGHWQPASKNETNISSEVKFSLKIEVSNK